MASAKDLHGFIQSFEYDTTKPNEMSKGFLIKLFFSHPKKPYQPTIDDIIKISGLNIDRSKMRGTLQLVHKFIQKNRKNIRRPKVWADLSLELNKICPLPIKKSGTSTSSVAATPKKKTQSTTKVRVLGIDCKGCIQKKKLLLKLQEEKDKLQQQVNEQELNFRNLQNTITTIRKQLQTVSKWKKNVKMVDGKEQIEVKLKERRHYYKYLSDSLTQQLFRIKDPLQANREVKALKQKLMFQQKKCAKERRTVDLIKSEKHLLEEEVRDLRSANDYMISQQLEDEEERVRVAQYSTLLRKAPYQGNLSQGPVAQVC